MSKPLRILGIPGSLRKDSYNRAALRAATELAPEGATIETYERVGELPLFSQDWEKNPPEVVTHFKERIRAADAILFVSPEYNFSIPGVLKNAIDCASRPYGDSAWTKKPAAIMGASTGAIGTARMQYHLRQCLVFLDMPTVGLPEVMIRNAADSFDKEGKLTDAKAREVIGKQLQALVALTRLHASAKN